MFRTYFGSSISQLTKPPGFLLFHFILAVEFPHLFAQRILINHITAPSQLFRKCVRNRISRHWELFELNRVWGLFTAAKCELGSLDICELWAVFHPIFTTSHCIAIAIARFSHRVLFIAQYHPFTAWLLVKFSENLVQCIQIDIISSANHSHSIISTGTPLEIIRASHAFELVHSPHQYIIQF